MKDKEYQIRKTDPDGLKLLVEWAQDEGWNPGIGDHDIYFQTDPDGFYGIFDGNEMIGGGSVVSYEGDFGFMGLFIVKRDYRSSGIGKQLWYFRRDTLLARLKPGASIGMEGVVNMQPFYAKGGFALAFRDERFELEGGRFEFDNRISRIDSGDFEKIHSYDTLCFGVDRKRFIKSWLQRDTAVGFKYEDGGKISGFAVIRKAAKGKRIGPLFADNPSIAEELLKACINEAEGEKVYIDVPDTGNGATVLAKKYGGVFVFECGRMYHGKPPEIPLEKLFGITTLELG